MAGNKIKKITKQKQIENLTIELVKFKELAETNGRKCRMRNKIFNLGLGLVLYGLVLMSLKLNIFKDTKTIINGTKIHDNSIIFITGILLILFPNIQLLIKNFFCKGGKHYEK